VRGSRDNCRRGGALAPVRNAEASSDTPTQRLLHDGQWGIGLGTSGGRWRRARRKTAGSLPHRRWVGHVLHSGALDRRTGEADPGYALEPRSLRPLNSSHLARDPEVSRPDRGRRFSSLQTIV
jgi:hypothetical protein